MNLTSIFSLVILILILFIVFQIVSIEYDETPEGYTTVDDVVNTISSAISPKVESFGPSWDFDFIREVNQRYNFSINGATEMEFIQYLQDTFKLQTITIKTSVPNSAAAFPPHGKGVCMNDWGTRSIRKRMDAQDQYEGSLQQHNYIKFDSSAANPELYNVCKERAEKVGANVFGLQLGVYCIFGNTPDLALGKVEDPLQPGYRATQLQHDEDPYKQGGVYGCWAGRGPNGNGSRWTQMVYAKQSPTSEKYRLENYEEIIAKITENGIYNFSGLKDTKKLNDKLPFTTIEGMTANSNPHSPIDMNNIITISTKSTTAAKPGTASASIKDVNSKILKILSETKYTVPKWMFSDFVKKMESYDIIQYIKTMQKFKISSEYALRVIMWMVVPQLNPSPTTLANHVAFIQMLMAFNVPDVYAVFNVSNWYDQANSWFLIAIAKHELHKLPFPMFPPTVPGANYNESVMIKVSNIGLTARELDPFFSLFKYEGVTSRVFFDTIYPILKSDMFNYHYTNTDDLRNIISYVKIISEGKGLAYGFTNFKSLLASLNLTFTSYKSFLSTFNAKLGTLTDIRGIMTKFTTYYQTIAYSDVNGGYTLKTPVSADMIFSEFVYKIDNVSGSTNDQYFSPVSDFNEYLRILIERKYTVANIQRDKKLGSTYAKFMGVQPTTTTIKSGFQSHRSDNSFETAIANVGDSIKSFFDSLMQPLFGNKEGLANLSYPQYNALLGFGIYDFNTQLSQLEGMLLNKGYGFNNLDDIIDFVQIVKTLIPFPLLSDYIKVLVDFGVPTRVEWLSVTTDLTGMGIKTFEDISAFLKIITNLGVRNSSLPQFKETMAAFKANFQLSRPSAANSAIGKFCTDMKKVQLNYDQNMDKINRLVNYFSAVGFDLQSYPELPSNLVNALYDYDQSGPKYKNELMDITPADPLSLILRGNNNDKLDIDNILMQGYLIASNQPTVTKGGGKSYQSLLLTDNIAISQLISFLYEEEYNAIKMDKQGTRYSNPNVRGDLMYGIALAMKKLSENHSSQYELQNFYRVLSQVIMMFPLLTFEFMVQTITTTCGNGNSCAFDNVVSPTYTYCKATTTNKTTNYRPEKPVLP